MTTTERLTTKTLDDFVREGDSRETSPEIMRAIAALARNYDEAVRVWESPTDEELERIVGLVTEGGRYHHRDFVWGAAGGQWADSVWA